MERVTDELYKAFVEAENEAVEKGIRTNTIFLNDKFDATKKFYRDLFDYAGYRVGTEYPPMILGKKVWLVSFLPDSYPFALTWTETPTAEEALNELKQELAVLKKYIHIDDKTGKFVFKGVSPKRNIKDYEKIEEIIGHE